MLEEATAVILMSILAGFSVFLALTAFLPRNKRFAEHLIDLQRRAEPHIPRIANLVFYTFVVVSATVNLAYVALLAQFPNSGGQDLATFDQIMWNSLRGRLFETTLTTFGTIHLAGHIDPVLLAIVPLYAVFSDSLVLRALQTLAVLGVAFPLYWFARVRIGYVLGLVVAFAFVISPVISFPNAFGFHEIPLAAPLLGLALFFVLRQKDWPTIVCVFVALLVREEVSLVVACLGLYVFFVQRRRRLGTTVFVLGSSWALLAYQVIMPYFAPEGNLVIARIYYPDLGDSIGQIVTTFVTRPSFVVERVLTPAKIALLFRFFAPLAFLPLLGIELTAIAGILMGGILLTGQDKLLGNNFPWHLTPVLPFLFFGGALGVQRILSWVSRPGKRPAEGDLNVLAAKAALATLILTGSILIHYLYSPLPLSRNFDLSALTPGPRIAIGQALVQEIPPDAVVSVPDDASPSFAQRRYVYLFPGFRDYRQIDFLFADTTGSWYNLRRNDWEWLLQTGYFEIVSRQDGFLLAKQRPLEHRKQVGFDGKVSVIGYAVPFSEGLHGGQVLRPILGIVADQNISKHYVLIMQLVDSQGHLWAQDPHDFLARPLAGTWPAGKILNDQFALQLPSILPTGDYQLVMGVRDPELDLDLDGIDADGRSLGNTIVLTSVHIQKDKSNVTAGELISQYQIDQPFFVDMREIRLIGFKSIPDQIASGQPLPIGLYWRARDKPRSDYAVSVQLRDTSGLVAFEQSARPAAGTYPTTEWDSGEVLLDWHDLSLPVSLSPGAYTVQVLLTNLADGSIVGQTALTNIVVSSP